MTPQGPSTWYILHAMCTPSNSPFCMKYEMEMYRRLEPPPLPIGGSFSNVCALILQPETLENVCRMIIHYLNMKW